MFVKTIQMTKSLNVHHQKKLRKKWAMADLLGFHFMTESPINLKLEILLNQFIKK
jgi:hypothetical protein